MLLIINASRNVQFLFFYIAWIKFRLSFQSQNSHHRASQISMSFRNPKSIFHFINIISIPATSAFLYKRIFLLSFSIFKQHFQFLVNKVSCLETLQFVKKIVNEKYCYCDFQFVKNQIKQSINKVTCTFPIL